MSLKELQDMGNAPDWYTEQSYETVRKGYLLPGETPANMYARVAEAAASRAKRPDLALLFFEIMWKGWLGPATPVLTNLGTERGLPISCYMTEMQDSVDSIFQTLHEVAAMSKAGGGVGVNFDKIRGRGVKIRTGGVSNGMLAWAKNLDVCVDTVSQGNRRGAAVANLSIEHPDWMEFIEARDTTGDPQLRVNNLHQSTSIPNSFMEKALAGDPEAREKWEKLMTTRWETGESYIMFIDHVNDNNPKAYKDTNKLVNTTNLCCLPADTEVLTSEGKRFIGDLVGETVKIFDGEHWVVNSGFEQKGEDFLYEIYLTDGRLMFANGQHRWFVKQGDSYVEKLTSKLRPGDVLEQHIYSAEFTAIVEETFKLSAKVKEPVYCTTVPTTGKFALANGVMTGNSEILQYIDEDHSVVCCLSSLNLASYNEWRDWKADNGMGLVELSVRFLDGVMEEFIIKAKELPGMEKAVAGAEKARSIGLGVMGWHSFLQQEMMPFNTSMETMMLNATVFRKIREEAVFTTGVLAKEYGEPEWLKGYGRRNMHLTALAPTRSNATICGGVSPSIEPWVANYYLDESAKGDFPVKNKELDKLLTKYDENSPKTWKSILRNDGSVQHLSFLTDHEKDVFKTAREINQKNLIRQAVQRQAFIDQGQSLNLFFPINADVSYVHDTHWLAWELGLKTLYYLRTGAIIKGDIIDECEACEG